MCKLRQSKYSEKNIQNVYTSYDVNLRRVYNQYFMALSAEWVVEYTNGISADE